MTNEVSGYNRDQYLSEIEKAAETKAGEDWKKRRWTAFIKEVVWWLHNDCSVVDEDMIDVVVGLNKYGISNEDGLLKIAGYPPDRKEFHELLGKVGVLCHIIDELFYKYVAPPPPQQQRHGSESGTQSGRKKQKLTQPFDINLLLPPLDVKPPSRPMEPPFTRSSDWDDLVRHEIFAQLESCDSDHGRERVPPMAVVRCSRGGKTRALTEIANMVYENSQEQKSDGNPVAVIFVSFNDFASLVPDEQNDPLGALCRRIVFSALRCQTDNAQTLTQAFRAFRAKGYDIRSEHILQWLGETRALLIVDELNNLNELKKLDSVIALEFGLFIKSTFIQDAGRYLVFSSHMLTTLGFFGEFADESYGSTRHVILQELPLVDNLSVAMKNLYRNLNGAREAIYFGLLPGMLYEHSRTKFIEGKRERAVSRYKEACKGKEVQAFKAVLHSLFSGSVKDPLLHDLQILLDACGESGSQKFRWVPYHLEYVLENVRFDDEKFQRQAQALAKLCKSLNEADETSGKGWEALFVLFLVARSMTGCSDGYFLPPHWFDVGKSPVSVLFNPYFNPHKPMSKCCDWDELKKGVEACEAPTVSIFYPSHASFNTYDAIAVFSAEKEFQEILGYQLKEGKINPKKSCRPCSDFIKSFVVKGDPPKKGNTNDGGWCTASGDTISKFFGESGKHWTPQHWKLLSDTCGKDSQKVT